MNLSCYIIDDEPYSIDVIKRYVEQTPGLILFGAAVNPLDALEIYTGPDTPNLTFLDVDMPQLNGLDLAELVSPVTKIIFTTAFRDYAPEAFEQNAVDYLIKPINYPRFLKSVAKVKQQISDAAPQPEANQSYFFVKSDVKGKFNRIEINQILYIENIGNYITIHSGQEKITTYLTLNEVLTKLPAAQFSRIHQSFIVNHAAIKSMDAGQVRLFDQLYLPIGGTYREGFRQKMSADILVSGRTNLNK